MDRTQAQRIADRYILPSGERPVAVPPQSLPPQPSVLEQMIADMELMARYGDDVHGCEACDVWLTMDEAVRCEDGPTLCPYQAYGGPKFPAEPCYRDRPWRHVHRHRFDRAEAARRTVELMDAERRGEPAQFHGGL